MALSYSGSLAIPLLCPSVYGALGLTSIALEAGLRGALALNASLTVTPPTVSLYLSVALQLQAQLELAISLGLPSVSFDLSAALALNVELELAVSLLLVLEGLLAVNVGIYAYSYSGIANGLGTALGAALGTTWPDGAPTSSNATAFILGATSPIATTQLQAFLSGLSVGPGLVYTAKLPLLSRLSIVTGLAIGQAGPALQAQISAAAKFTSQASVIPPSLDVTAKAVVKYLALLRSQLSFAPPAVSAAISASANLSADLEANFGFVCQLGACLNRYDATLFGYVYSGPANALGAAVTTALASTWGDGTTPTTTGCYAAILGATDTISVGAMGSFFGGL